MDDCEQAEGSRSVGPTPECTYTPPGWLVQNCNIETRHYLGVTNQLVVLQQTRETTDQPVARRGIRRVSQENGHNRELPLRGSADISSHRSRDAAYM